MRSWQHWQRIGFGRGLVVAGLLLIAPAVPVLAQTLESVLRPGEVIQGHAKWEDDCSKCHVRFDRAAQDRLCMDCHKDIGRDMRERTGYHGRLKPQPCRACHTDHKGRAARIAEFEKNDFDHAQTDYVLRGKHRQVECDKCHLPSKKYSEAAHECNACHRKDDVHKGSLGPKCADCHTDNSWKETRFDHGATRFPLTGKHVDTKCTDCHKDTNYKQTPRTCIGCHRSDDDRKGHKGQFGERCDSCHGTKAWKPSIFNHDVDTKYPLRGKHRPLKCASCHTGHIYKDKVGSACVDCHRNHDPHKGSLGRECAACHTERDWKDIPRFDHDRTKFPLLGRHRDAKCADCHKSPVYKEAPSECLSCHRKDDKHEGTLGKQCQDCHVERDWKTTTRFDHDKTRFKLRNAHAAKTVACKACHADAKHYRDTPTDCLSCHRKDDKHEGQLSTRCESCHGDVNWKTTRFAHARTHFPLVGKHVVVKCADCHATARYKDAASDCWSCHRKDDKHKLRFGTACESCHNARAWGLWNYDHARQAKYGLDGAHAKTACASCHTAPAPAGKAAAPVGTACIGCHRRDDRHDGAFGPNCDQCHYADTWKRFRSRVGDAGTKSAPIGSVLRRASHFVREPRQGGGT